MIKLLISGVEIKISVTDSEDETVDVTLKGLLKYDVDNGTYHIGTNVRYNNETYEAKVVLTVNDDKTKATGEIIFDIAVSTPP